MGRFFNCLNNGNRNYHTFCSSDDNVFTSKEEFPSCIFLYSPAASILPQSIYGPQKGASREDIVNMAHWMQASARKNLSDTVEQVMRVVRQFS